MEIQKQEAETLPYYLRQQVLEECQKRATLNWFLIVIYVIFAGGFAAAGIFMPMKFVSEFSAQYAIGFLPALLIHLIGVPFLIFPVLLTYLFFFKPKRLLKLAEAEQYSCHIGQLTDKKEVHTRDGDGDTYHNYYLILDGVVKCRCDYTEYNKAVIGAQYMAVFFGKKKPEFCLSILE